MAYRPADPAGAFATALNSTMSSLAQADEIALRVGERNDKRRKENALYSSGLLMTAMTDEDGVFDPNRAVALLNTDSVRQAAAQVLASGNPSLNGLQIEAMDLRQNPADPSGNTYALFYQDGKGQTHPVVAERDPKNPDNDKLLIFDKKNLPVMIAGALAAVNPERFDQLSKRAREFREENQDAAGVTGALNTLAAPTPPRSIEGGLSTAAGAPSAIQRGPMPAGAPSAMTTPPPRPQPQAPSAPARQQPTPEAAFLPPGEDLTAAKAEAPQAAPQGNKAGKLWTGEEWVDGPEDVVNLGVELIRNSNAALQKIRAAADQVREYETRGFTSDAEKARQYLSNLQDSAGTLSEKEAQFRRRFPELMARAESIVNGTAMDAEEAQQRASGAALRRGAQEVGRALTDSMRPIAEVADDVFKVRPKAEIVNALQTTDYGRDVTPNVLVDAASSGLSAAANFIDGVTGKGSAPQPQPPSPAPQPQAASAQEKDKGFGFSQVDPGRAKTAGWFGPLTTPSGKVMTELSTTVDFDNREMEIPLVNPLLTEKELRFLQRNADDPRKVEMPESILQKAEQWALQRMRAGRSPYPTDEETAARQAQLKERGFSSDLPAAPTAGASTSSRSTNAQGETVWQAPPPRSANPSPAQVAASSIQVSGPIAEQMSDDKLKALTTQLGRLVTRGKMDFSAAAKIVQRAAGTEPLEVKVADNRILYFNSQGNLIGSTDLGLSEADLAQLNARAEQTKMLMGARHAQAGATRDAAAARSADERTKFGRQVAEDKDQFVRNLFPITEKSPRNLERQNWLGTQMQILEQRGVIDWGRDPQGAMARVRALVDIADQRAKANDAKWGFAGLRDTGPTDITDFSLTALLNETQATTGMPRGAPQMQAADFLNLVGDEGRAKLNAMSVSNEEIANLIAGTVARLPPDADRQEAIQTIQAMFRQDPVAALRRLAAGQRGAQ